MNRESAVDLNARLRTLGLRLRSHRKIAQLTGEQLAQVTHVSQPKISRIECGKALPSPQDVELLASALDIPAIERAEMVDEAADLAEHSRRWRAIHGRGLVSAQREALFTEQMATHIRFFQPHLIPGLLQYRQYAWDVIQRANITNQTDLDEAVRIRMERQDLLHTEHRSFEFILLESALYARYSTPDVMIVQLDLLRSLAKLSHVSIGIVPNSRQLPHAPVHGFGIFDDTSVAVELVHGETIINDSSDIALYTTVFSDFKAIADYGPDAEALIISAQQAMEAPPTSRQ